MNVEFRKVREVDLKRLNDIVNDKSVAKYLKLIPPVSMKSTRDFYKKTKTEDLVWVAVIADEEIAGSYSTQRGPKGSKAEDEMTIGICIDKPWWGTGVSDKAMEKIIGDAKKAKVKRIDLVVEQDNKKAVGLYQRHGFKVEGVKRKAVKTKRGYKSLLVMGKVL